MNHAPYPSQVLHCALVNVLSYVFKTLFQLLVLLFRITSSPLLVCHYSMEVKNQQSCRCHIVFHLLLSFSYLFLQCTLKDLSILMVFKSTFYFQSTFYFLSRIQFNWLFLPTAPYLTSCSFVETFAGIFSYSCGLAGKESACSAGDLGSIPGLGRSPGERKGYLLRYSGLENCMDSSWSLNESDMTEQLSLHFSYSYSLVNGGIKALN